MRVDLRGEKEVQKFFKKLSFRQQKQVIRGAHVIASQPYRKHLKTLAASHIRTSQLSKSIGVVNSKKYKGFNGLPALRAGFISKKGGWYAKFLEFGTKAHGPKKDGRLKFFVNGVYTEANQVSGVKPIKMHERSLNATKEKIVKEWGKYYFTSVNRMANRILKRYA